MKFVPHHPPGPNEQPNDSRSDSRPLLIASSSLFAPLWSLDVAVAIVMFLRSFHNADGRSEYGSRGRARSFGPTDGAISPSHALQLNLRSSSAHTLADCGRRTPLRRQI